MTILIPHHLKLSYSNSCFGRIVIAVSSGGQHTVMIAKDKVEEETAKVEEKEANGEGMEVANGQAVNGEAIQEEPEVNEGAEEEMVEN